MFLGVELFVQPSSKITDSDALLDWDQTTNKTLLPYKTILEENIPQKGKY